MLTFNEDLHIKLTDQISKVEGQIIQMENFEFGVDTPFNVENYNFHVSYVWADDSNYILAEKLWGLERNYVELLENYKFKVEQLDYDCSFCQGSLSVDLGSYLICGECGGV